MTTQAVPRRMRDPEHRQWVWENRYADQVRGVNEWVDSRNTASRWMPYVSPVHSTEARVLSVLRDPGSAADWGLTFGDTDERRGFLSMENDDDAAEESLRLVTEVAGLDTGLVFPWNAHPFFLGHDDGPDTGQISEGAKHLKLLLREVLTNVHHVVLQGTEAKKCWDVLRSRDTRFTNGYRVWRTWNPAPRALAHDRASRGAHREDTWRGVSEALLQ